MKQRILCLFLAVLMIFGCIALLSSCDRLNKTDKKTTDNKTVTPTTPVTPGEDEEEEEPVDVAYELWRGENNTKTIRMCINDATDDSVLSGGRGYIAGNNEWTSNSAVAHNDILKLVSTRNANGSIYANVNVKYDYSDWTWGKASDEINKKVLSGVADLPDIYYQNVYDMVASSVRGNFKNILGNAYLNSSEDGYNKDYMDILSFSTKKQFLLASDFCTDISRAFFVVPVSVDILTAKNALGENQSTMADFYDVIDNNEWTWDLVATMCNNVKQTGGDGVSYVFNEGTVGMAVDTNAGMAAAGMLYSSPVKIITRSIGNDGEYVYTYDPDGQALVDVADKLKQTIGSTDGFVAVNDLVDGVKTVQAIAQSFSEGHILIGNVIILGAIETSYYKDMWDTANEKYGFVVAPMPLYEGGTAADGWSYITVVHNTAKVFGVSASSRNLDRCVAYLDYGSRHSTNILEEFFQWTILYEAAGADEKNVEYLIQMKGNMSYNLDKTVDDALAYFKTQYSPNGSNLYDSSNKYHRALQNGNGTTDEFPFKIGAGIKTIYDETYQNKQSGLALLQTDFASNK